MDFGMKDGLIHLVLLTQSKLCKKKHSDNVLVLIRFNQIFKSLLDSTLYRKLTSKPSLRAKGTSYTIENFKRIYKYYSAIDCANNTFECIKYMIVDCLYSYTGYGNVNFYPGNPNNWPI